MKVWITKYALTKGIIEKDGEVGKDYPKMFCVRNIGLLDEHYHHPEWHLSIEEAKNKLIKW